MKTPDFNVMAGDRTFAEWLSAIETGAAIGVALLAAARPAGRGRARPDGDDPGPRTAAAPPAGALCDGGHVRPSRETAERLGGSGPGPPREERRAASRTALLTAAGVAPTPAGVAGMYRDIAHRFVLDTADAEQLDAVAELGVEPVVAPTLLHLDATASDLVDAVLGVHR